MNGERQFVLKLEIEPSENISRWDSSYIDSESLNTEQLELTESSESNAKFYGSAVFGGLLSTFGLGNLKYFVNKVVDNDQIDEYVGSIVFLSGIGAFIGSSISGFILKFDYSQILSEYRVSITYMTLILMIGIVTFANIIEFVSGFNVCFGIGICIAVVSMIFSSLGSQKIYVTSLESEFIGIFVLQIQFSSLALFILGILVVLLSEFIVIDSITMLSLSELLNILIPDFDFISGLFVIQTGFVISIAYLLLGKILIKGFMVYQGNDEVSSSRTKIGVLGILWYTVAYILSTLIYELTALEFVSDFGTVFNYLGVGILWLIWAIQGVKIGRGLQNGNASFNQDNPTYDQELSCINNSDDEYIPVYHLKQKLLHLNKHKNLGK